ncbi:hypothetical protein D4765_15540 [Subtercola vilae]|uniref:Multidrug ABC transporter ATPase n=2 Tax=Microbacteriaceae TaxID=85023 RepID=A0A4T2BLY3_9MICO|nr:hypothetical protein D4765_15540 [Subtercola vilae]
MVASAAGLSILCFIAVIIGTGVGVRNFGVGVWPIVVVLPIFGFPLAIAFLIALLIVNLVRRSREARNST